MTPDVLYGFLLQQFSAESYIGKNDALLPDVVSILLRNGNNRSELANTNTTSNSVRSRTTSMTR